MAATAPNISIAEPLFNPTISGNKIGTVGLFGSNKLDVPYKGINQENYTVSRAQAGLLLTFDASKVEDFFRWRRADESDASTSNETSGSESGESTSKPKKKKSSSFSTYYLQAPVSDSAELAGAGNLHGNTLSGRNHSVGLAYGFGYSGSGMFVFYEGELIDENVSYMDNGVATSGKLEGTDFTFGLGISFSGGPRFALAGTISYSYSKLTFISQQESFFTAAAVEQEDKVSRSRRANFGIMATFNVLPNLHLNLHALTGSEESAAGMIRYSF